MAEPYAEAFFGTQINKNKNKVPSTDNRFFHVTREFKSSLTRVNIQLQLQIHAFGACLS